MLAQTGSSSWLSVFSVATTGGLKAPSTWRPRQRRHIENYKLLLGSQEERPGCGVGSWEADSHHSAH